MSPMECCGRLRLMDGLDLITTDGVAIASYWIKYQVKTRKTGVLIKANSIMSRTLEKRPTTCKPDGMKPEWLRPVRCNTTE